MWWLMCFISELFFALIFGGFGRGIWLWEIMSCGENRILVHMKNFSAYNVRSDYLNLFQWSAEFDRIPLCDKDYVKIEHFFDKS